MGVVVAATHLELGHRVAIKLLREDLAGDATGVERFLREARAVVQLRTEHVCRVFDVGRTGAGEPYIVMELLEGNDLGRAIATQPLPVTIAVEYIMQACVAVAEAHAAGVIHRDLKPSNLIVTRRPGGGPLIKVLDFGIAKAMTEPGDRLTHSQSMLGSPGYISPEQLQSARDVDARTDIWALGATLYQLVSGRLPFHAATATAMAVRIMMQPPDPLDVDPRLGAVIFRCLEKAPDRRYPDVAALVSDLVPFGGASAHAIAASVTELCRGAIAPTSPIARPPFAAVGSASTTSIAGPRSATAVSSASHDPLARSRRAWWWIAAPLVVLASVGTGVICARRDATAPAPAPSVAAVKTNDDRAATPVPADAGIADPAPSMAADASNLESPSWLPDNPDTVARPQEARPNGARSGVAPRPVAPAQAGVSSPRDTIGHGATPPGTGGRESNKPTVAGAMADSARDAKANCLESAADTPWNTAMCWCAKKDRARAEAAFARLSGFKRATVRTWCAVRGVNL